MQTVPMCSTSVITLIDLAMNRLEGGKAPEKMNGEANEVPKDLGRK